jgi:hypothetical protein
LIKIFLNLITPESPFEDAKEEAKHANAEATIAHSTAAEAQATAKEEGALSDGKRDEAERLLKVLKVGMN